MESCCRSDAMETDQSVRWTQLRWVLHKITAQPTSPFAVQPHQRLRRHILTAGKCARQTRAAPGGETQCRDNPGPVVDSWVGKTSENSTEVPRTGIASTELCRRWLVSARIRDAMLGVGVALAKAKRVRHTERKGFRPEVGTEQCNLSTVVASTWHAAPCALGRLSATMTHHDEPGGRQPRGFPASSTLAV